MMPGTWYGGGCLRSRKANNDSACRHCTLNRDCHYDASELG